MNTQFLVTCTFSRRNPYTQKSYSFVKGERITWARLKRAGFTSVPTDRMIELSKWDSSVLSNNLSIDKNNKKFEEFDFTSEELTQIEEVTSLLQCKYQRSRSDFTFVKCTSNAFANSDSLVLWVGVKMTETGHCLVGKQNKPVTLGNNNYVAANTFLYRVNNGLALFASEL